MRRAVPLLLGAGALCAVLVFERARSAAEVPASTTAPVASAPLVAPKLARPDELLARFPPLAVQPRKAALEEKGSYPCSECHDESLANDPRERELTDAHDDIVLVHGGGRLWCTTCHHDDRGQLRSLKGEPIDFDQSFLLCGECHFQQQRDFFYGAHGKRVGNWNAAREALTCTACHEAHDPSIKARLPWRSGRPTQGGKDAG